MTKQQTIDRWRQLSGELDTSKPISDADVVTHYLEPAAQDLNRRIEYFYKDSTVALVAGTQEYAQPEDFVKVVFVELGDEILTKTDIEELRRKQPDWRQTPAGRPEHYFLYGGKIGFWPEPDADAAALTCTVRHLATPTLSTNPGYDLLSTHDHEIPVLRAVQKWFEAHGWDYEFSRAARFEKLFETEADRVRGFYAERLLQRGP